MRLKKLKTNKGENSIFFSLVVLPIILSLIGLIFIFESSAIRALNEASNSFYYVRLQAIWLLIGITLLIFFSFFDYKKFYLLSAPLMFLTIFFLLIVLIPKIGHSAGGARRWLDFGYFKFQPTEFAKLTTIIYLSSWFTVREKRRFFSFIFLIALIIGLILLQPDMGSAFVIYCLALIIYFLAGVELRYLFFFTPVSILGFAFLIIAAPYRFQRLLAFTNPSINTRDVAYHINQILISLANGGIFGQGIGASRQKYLFLPEAHTDSIFAILSEEVGFVGGVVLVFIYFVILYRLYILYNLLSDRFEKLLIGGIFGFFAMQIITNLGGMVALIPLTGVPLPFISYGGSHLLVSFILLGIAVNIFRHKIR